MDGRWPVPYTMALAAAWVAAQEQLEVPHAMAIVDIATDEVIGGELSIKVSSSLILLTLHQT